MILLIQNLIYFCVLWFLIVLFTGSHDGEKSRREALICAGIAVMVGLVFSWFIPAPFKILGGPLQWVVLFYLIDWICGCARSITWRIVIWFFASSLLIRLLSHVLQQPV
jgi:hypothetical protein